MSLLRSLQRPLRSLTLVGCAPRQLPRTCTLRPLVFLSNEPTLRRLQTSAARHKPEHATPPTAPWHSESDPASKDVYIGPLSQTFRRVKIFSLSSLSLSLLMTPFIFMLETSSAVPFIGRIALTGTVIVASTVSTALVAWCGRPYVNKLRWIPVEESIVAEKQPTSVELTTATLILRTRITRVYDSAFLVPTNRPFAKWELAEAFKLPPAEAAAEKAKGNLPREETVAETMDKDGKIVGRWIVRWDEDGAGTCREMGKIVRYVDRVRLITRCSFFRAGTSMFMRNYFHGRCDDIYIFYKNTSVS